MPKQATRLAVQKTYKLFIGGKFARSESGRIIAARDAEGKVLANLPPDEFFADPFILETIVGKRRHA